MIFGAGDWDEVGRLTLRRVRALYAAWAETPPVATMVAGYLGIKGKGSKKRAKKTQVQDGIAAFLADFGAAGGAIIKQKG